MSLNAELRRALACTGLPVVPHADARARNRCLVFSLTSVPAQWADNRPLLMMCLVQVHLFLPEGENGLSLRGEILAALNDAGWKDAEETDAGDGRQQHYVYECETARRKDDIYGETH